jgi:DNA-binding NarL/FixJ family response regulator
MKKPDLILVDDHQVFRQGIKSLISIENIANIIGEASNGEEFLELLSHLKPDLVLMDIEMPDMNGIDATRKALEIMPDLKIIALSMFDDEEYVCKMKDAGAKGFIRKSGGIIEIEIAIREVLAGGDHFSDELKKQYMSS